MITQDQLWKGLIEDFFPQLFAFFYPKKARYFDLARTEFLEQELAQLVADDEGHDRRVDKLVKLYRRNGSTAFMLIHLEVQGYYDKNFARRMFTYAYRIFDRYGMVVESLAILTDRRKHFHPKLFTAKAFGTELTYKFTTYKLLDQNREELAASRNPFALALLVAYDAIQQKAIPDGQLLALKIRFFRRLLELGFSKAEIGRLAHFIKHYSRFQNPKMNDTFDQHIVELTNKQEGMGIIERVQNAYKQAGFEEGMKKGMRKGIKAGKLEGKQEGRQEGKLEGKLEAGIESLVTLRDSGLYSHSSNEELARVFQLPVAWVGRILSGDVPTPEELQELLSSKKLDKPSH